MNRIVGRALMLVAALQLLWACAVVDRTQPASVDSSLELERVAQTLTSLNKLENIDAYIKLNNSLLRTQIRDGLLAQSVEAEAFEVSKIKVRFSRQVITLETDLRIDNGPNEPLSATLYGDVIVAFSGNQLIWLPHFDRLSMSDTDFLFEQKHYPEATGELEQQLLLRVNREITEAVIVLGKNVLQINAIPLGQIEVGAAITNFSGVSSTNKHDLGGVFTIAGSAILVEPDVTSIAVDLEFIPNISACPADLSVSRSTFARTIKNREPVGIIRLLGGELTESHFFTEISGATRSSTVIHYWFADGRPVALEELHVEPSYRWRTWSSKTIDSKQARNWEVIVVDKQTGCILHSQAIGTDPTVSDVQDGLDNGQLNVASLRREFERRVSGFSILEEQPDIALIEVPRPFLNDALRASLKDIRIAVDFDISGLSSQQQSGSLQPFSPDEIKCAERICAPQRECDSGFTQCTRHRDTRDCSTCLFRNPLNNRCVNEGIDPICQAAKTAQNEQYEAARSVCIEQETAARMDCERLSAQEMRSCEIEATSQRSSCEAARETVRKFSDSGSLADILVEIKTGGRIRAVFSDFELESDLANIRQILNFSAALDVSGAIRFAPNVPSAPLSSCMNAWQKLFHGKVMLPGQTSSMIGPVEPTVTALVTNWSGYVVTASITPTPLEDMFVENPNLLADCHLGLTVDKVAAAVTGASSDYLRGRFHFEIQPLPSHIDLAVASIRYGDKKFEAEPQLMSTHLRYEIQE